MQAQLVRWGNSVAVRIPKRALEQTKWAEGDSLELIVKDRGTIALKLITEKPTLADMLDAITPENLHGEIEWGKPVGNET